MPARPVWRPDQIVAFSRLETRLNAEMVNVADVLEEVVRDSSERYKDDGVAVHCDLSVAPLQVLTDRTNLYSMLLNLVHNARDAILEAKSNGRGGNAGTIRISAGREGEMWLLSVRDDGAGIDDENKERVFDAFYTTKPDSGTGLGLALVNRFVQSIGGSIHVASRPGDTTFLVRMPVQPDMLL